MPFADFQLQRVSRTRTQLPGVNLMGTTVEGLRRMTLERDLIGRQQRKARMKIGPCTRLRAFAIVLNGNSPQVARRVSVPFRITRVMFLRPRTIVIRS